ncbi:MAG: 4-hydroxy-3-methylbut-2-enyl diphosphate reductase [bacterium]|nr:4-hydroxy-3-methylbut-2-enyl diphosphate reductase [bacterium]
MQIKKVILVKPRGFCAGVEYAIKIAEEISNLKKENTKVYLNHELVHNRNVLNRLISKKVVDGIIENPEEVPKDAIWLLSAHGTDPKIKNKAINIGIKVIDATCPLVKKVHLEVRKYIKLGYKIIYICHKNHPEAVAVCSLSKDIYPIETIQDIENLHINGKIVYLTQTTLSIFDVQEIVRKLKEKFPNIEAPPKEDICYATTNRQIAVDKLCEYVDVVVVVGYITSSNSNRLKEIASRKKPAYLVSDSKDLKKEWFKDVKVVGVTAGASAPEEDVLDVVKWFNPEEIEELKIFEENIKFALPQEVRSIS